MMCGGDVGCPKTYGKNLISVGSGLMSGEGKGKKIRRAAKSVEKFARKTAGKKNLKKVAGQAIEKGIPAVAGFAAGTAASSMGMNPVAGAVAGAAAEEGVRRSGVGKKLRKKAGLGVGKDVGRALKRAGRKVGHQALDEAEGLADDALSAGKKKARKALGSDKRGSGLKKTSKWIEHVKKVAKDKGIAYGEALKVAKETYQKN